jgi:hypothetical protein
MSISKCLPEGQQDLWHASALPNGLYEVPHEVTYKIGLFVALLLFVASNLCRDLSLIN